MPAKKPHTEEELAKAREKQRRYQQTAKGRAKHREKQRLYQQTEKVKAYQREYRQAHLAAKREREKRNRQSRPDEAKAARDRWRATHKEHIAEYNRQYALKHPEVCRAAWRKYELKRCSIRRVRTSPEEVYRRAMAALPSGLPRFIRDDVVSSLCLAILEGEINVNDMAAQAKVYLRAYNREYDTFQTVSLDVLIPGTKTTYLDALAAE
jgi:hypothetical protein